jgi:GTP cyclohydrolase I
MTAVHGPHCRCPKIPAAECAGANGVVSVNGMTPDRAEAAVRALLAALGVPDTEHTKRTPERVAVAWRHMLRGYQLDPRRHLAVTFPGAVNAPLVCQAGLRVTSTCAHHLLPITGWATVAYRPRSGAPIVGLSKLARVLEEYAARATVQEWIGDAVARALAEELDTEGAACVITAEHGCMTLRGVTQHAARTTTVSLAGEWAEGPRGQVIPDVEHVLADHRAACHG